MVKTRKIKGNTRKNKRGGAGFLKRAAIAVGRGIRGLDKVQLCHNQGLGTYRHSFTDKTKHIHITSEPIKDTINKWEYYNSYELIKNTVDHYASNTYVKDMISYDPEFDTISNIDPLINKQIIFGIYEFLLDQLNVYERGFKYMKKNKKSLSELPVYIENPEYKDTSKEGMPIATCKFRPILVFINDEAIVKVRDDSGINRFKLIKNSMCGLDLYTSDDYLIKGISDKSNPDKILKPVIKKVILPDSFYDVKPQCKQYDNSNAINNVSNNGIRPMTRKQAYRKLLTLATNFRGNTP